MQCPCCAAVAAGDLVRQLLIWLVLVLLLPLAKCACCWSLLQT
jgi:hypothetical protein